MERKDEVAEEYLSSLADLNINSKPLINMLTILAEENIEYASVIVDAVEHHISKVNPDIKLPVLYLIDSIVKNVGRNYITLFGQRIVDIFCGVFAKVDEKVREKMYTLRQTWNDVFPVQKLLALDCQVNRLDRNWPITAKLSIVPGVAKSPAIHVNPNFLKNQTEPIGDMQAKLRDKQRQLLELQKRKLELELAATKQRLEEQEKQLTMQTEAVKSITLPVVIPPIITASEPSKQMLNSYNRPQQPKQPSGITMANNLAAGVANQNASKVRIAPVSQNMLNTLRYRDPRLARQQLQQQQQQSQTADNVVSSTVTKAQNSILKSAQHTQISSSNAINESKESVRKEPSHSDPRRSDDKTGNESNKSNSNRSNLNSRSSSNQGDKDRSRSSSSSTSSGSNNGGVRKQRESYEKSDKSPRSKSSGRNSSSTKSSSSPGSKSTEKESKIKDKSSSSSSATKSDDKKKSSSKNFSPTRSSGSDKSPSKIERSPKKISSDSPKRTGVGSPSDSQIKFKDLKQGTKSRNYVKRDREKCESPSLLTEKPQDIDLRSGPIPDKRLKLDEQVTTINCISNSSSSSSILTNSIVTTTPVATIATKTTTTTSKSKDLEKNLEAVKSNKDVDLRQFPTTVNTNNKSLNLMGGTAVTSILCNKIDTKLDGGKFSPILLSNDKCSSSSDDKFEMVMDIDSTKKRQSGSKLDEPISKKIKSQSEKIDDLFGKEDVDLRNLSGVPPHLTSTVGVSGGVMPMTPPPPPVISNESENWAKVKGSKSNKVSPTSASSFDDVRAKLAKATKNHLQKINGNEKNRDNKKCRFSDVNEDSSDGTDANIRTIISQAQELLASENINLEQYNTLVKTVIQINETNKLKEAQRRESLQNNTPTKAPQNKVSTSPAQSQASKDSEIKQRDDEEEDHTSILKAKSKALQKRIPKLPKDAPTAEVNIEQNSVLQRTSPPISTNSNYSDNRINAVNVKQDKRIGGRQKDSKWPSPWEQAGQNHPNHQNHQNQSQNQNKPWIPPMGANMNRLQFNPKVLPPNHPPMNQIAPQNRMQLPNPWNNPPPMIFAGAAMPMPQIIPPTAATADNSIVPIKQFCNSVDNPKDDVVRSINIDSVAKEIRIYEEVAIVFMDWDQPREIGFQNGQRRIIIDDQEPITLNFNDIYTTIIIAGKPHRIRFGCPSRELYIDDNWYECCFGGPPMAIPVDGKMSIIKIEGPPPQVNIGNLRQDLVAGKINLVIDARILVPIFLDAKIQRFELDGKKHTLQFADCLKTVLIDGESLNVEYGGLPRSLFLGGVKYFVRFGTLPNGIIPGKHFIKDMIRTENFPPPLPTPTALNAIKPPVSNPIVTSALTVASVPDIKATSVSSVLPVLTTTTVSLPCIQTDIKATNLITTPATTTTSTTETNVITTQNTVEPCSKVVIPTTTGTITEQIKPPQPILPPVANLNIDELFQKLLASGILNQNVTNAVASQDPNSKKQKEEDVILPIDLSKSETIKTRQAGIVQKIFSGMQCSSCGVRFPPEQTMKYSQHLDWHFRQNRRERDSSRKAHSRKWYYDVSDWIQYEEIEDIDEREKNWFEAQQSEQDNPDDNSNSRINSPSPSCPAGPDDVDRACDMCHDKFEQFYNEESEEWHLRSAIRVEDKIYHPLCYQDYKASLTMEEETLPGIEIADNDNAVDIVVIVKEEKTDDDEKSDVIVEDDDDDVIVLPTEEPLITEIPSDDDDEEYAAANKSVLSANNPDTNDTTEKSTETSVNVTDENKTENKDSDTAAAADNETNPNDSVESDVEIQEPHIPFTDLDTYEEPPASLSTFDDSSQQSASQFNVIKIKEEPKDSDNEDDVFEDVGTFVSVDEISENVDEYVPQTVSAPSSDLVASIDGNVEIQDTHVSTTNVGVNKIRINITKNTTTTASSMTGVSNIPTITTSASNNITVTLSSNNNQVEKPQHIPVIESGSAIPVICNFNKDTSNFVINLNKRDDKKNQSPIPDKDKSQLLSKNDRSNTNTNNSSGSGGVGSADGGSGTKGNSKDNSKSDGGSGNNNCADIDDGSSIKYDLKPPLRGVELKKTPKVDSGFETSGLCSIM